MAKRKQYDDKFRASAVVMLEAAGYPDQPYKLEEIARVLKVPSRTLRRWFNRENNPPPDKVVTELKISLAELFEQVARRYLAHALDEDVVEDAGASAAATIAAIAIDKIQLLTGQATSRNENISVDNSERARRINELLDAARTRRTGQSTQDKLQ